MFDVLLVFLVILLAWLVLRCCRQKKHLAPAKKDDTQHDVERGADDDEEWVDFKVAEQRGRAGQSEADAEPEAAPLQMAEEEEPDPFAMLGIVPTIQKQQRHIVLDQSPWQAQGPTSASLSLGGLGMDSGVAASGAWGDDDMDLGSKRRVTAEERRRARQPQQGSERKKSSNRLAVTHQEM